MSTIKEILLYCLIAGGAACAGFLFYGLYNDYIIIRLPSRPGALLYEQPLIKRKNTKFFYWHNGKFACEEKMVLHSADKGFTLTELITHWLATLEQELAPAKRVSLEHVLLDHSGTEAFISFDRSPFMTAYSTFQKIMWVEGLLKTLKDADLGLQKVSFFAESKPLVDPHLDFSHAYPLTGYINLS